MMDRMRLQGNQYYNNIQLENCQPPLIMAMNRQRWTDSCYDFVRACMWRDA